MSVDTDLHGGELADPDSDIPVDLEKRSAAKPIAHGAGVVNVLNDRDGTGTLYDTALSWWRENIGDKDHEPGIVAGFETDWLPELPDGHEHVLLVTSSRWKAGRGTGADYTAYYDQHIKLRRLTDDGDLEKPALSLHLELMPQYTELVYKSGDPLECPYGEGTRLVAKTTYVGSAEEIERRAYDALRVVYGDDSLTLDASGTPVDRNYESRKTMKAEAHLRLDVAKKNAVVETIEQSKQLIDWGGHSEIDAAQEREAKGWVEARCRADRWDLLGFADMPFKTGLKVYQVPNWHKKSDSDPLRHPKLEAAFEGVDRGGLPHVDQWDELMAYLRGIVSTHTAWAGVERADLVADDFFDGAGADTYEYHHPTGRREMLRKRYEDRATEVWRAAVHPQTTAIYDILRVVAREYGASYDQLAEETGLARSTVRYHVAKLEERGVLKRLGNPVLVVYNAEALRERADEILRSVRPDDTREQAEERAREREQRREELPDSDTGEDDGGADGAEDGASPAEQERDRARSTWAYLGDLRLSAADLYVELDTTAGALGDEDVRVRTDHLPDRMR